MRSQPPTRDQILNLIDRAELKGLTAAEAARLREGFDLTLPLHKTSPAVRWSARISTLRRRLHELHNPISFNGQTICAECSSFNGIRPLGFTVEWPCPTIDALDTNLPRSVRHAA